MYHLIVERAIRYVSFLAVAVSAFGQTFELKDRKGTTVVTIDDVKMFRFSNYFKETIPVFQATVKNVSGEKLLGVSIVGTVHKKDGTVVEFRPYICDTLIFCDFPKSFSHETTYPFGQPWPLYPADFVSVEFALQSAKRLTTKDGFRFSGFVSKDEGCLADYLATTSLTGVLLRKKLTELVEYGCGFVVDSPQGVLVLDGSKKTFGVGAKKVAAVHVIVLDEAILLGQGRSPHALEDGWVLASGVVRGPVLEVEELGVKSPSEKEVPQVKQNENQW
jgi:hypothetical protein